MSDAMKQFLEILSKDETLQEQMKNCKSPEEAFSVAGAVAGELEEKEFYDIMTKIRELAEKRQSGELSDDDLDLVAGGFATPETMEYIGYAMAGVTAAAIFAAF